MSIHLSLNSSGNNSDSGLVMKASVKCVDEFLLPNQAFARRQVLMSSTAQRPQPLQAALGLRVHKPSSLLVMFQFSQWYPRDCLPWSPVSSAISRKHFSRVLSIRGNIPIKNLPCRQCMALIENVLGQRLVTYFLS